ncbi:hypothetical protein CROQUDRAFT_92847 [Cronartium quercuum f. sp. fusiforme G11]|uniref:Uncharacterized protein n=1 Tax=Cronartium quercuum f. sp. fusiforme G11 TaxID=708437 RepID=A0A9P6NHV4_9BASI|nr:hypothetical protein CROQUDRAFT_92847 [Cronartium quercuum f. sp. fusiforme G11]
MDTQNQNLLVNDDNYKNPKALWDVVITEYASKKACNRSRLYTQFLNLNYDDLLAHMALHHLPEDHKTTLGL